MRQGLKTRHVSLHLARRLVPFRLLADKAYGTKPDEA